jgi:hypothetical protein
MSRGVTPDRKPLWQWAVVWWAIGTTLLMIRGWILVYPARLGLIVHPPLWFEIAVGVLTLCAAVGGWMFVALQDRGSVRRRKGHGTEFALAVSISATTWIGLGWALPGLSAFVIVEPRFIERTVTDVEREGRRARLFCRQRVRFESVLAGGGGLCLDSRLARGLEGATLEMIGRGNGWATRVEAITAVRHE